MLVVSFHGGCRFFSRSLLALLFSAWFGGCSSDESSLTESSEGAGDENVAGPDGGAPPLGFETGGAPANGSGGANGSGAVSGSGAGTATGGEGSGSAVGGGSGGMEAGTGGAAGGNTGEPSGGTSGGTGSGGSGAGKAWLTAEENVKLMPLGDSITAQGSCWRSKLYTLLMDAGLSNIDFVGSQTASDCGGNYDSDHEGHGGVLVTQVTEEERDAWLSNAAPDVILLHFATNDVWNGVSTEDILSAHLGIVEAARAENPGVIVLQAQIIPMAPSACAECAPRISALNAAMVDWAAQHGTEQSPIFVVDQNTGFDAAVDTTDGVHPYTESGAEKMAQAWFLAISMLYGR